MTTRWIRWAKALGVIGGTVLLHEVAHAVAARRVGGTVREVGIGFGPPIARGRVGDVAVTIRPVPLGGFAAIDIERLPPHRRLPVLIVGPAANIVAGVVLRALAGLGDRGDGRAVLPGQTRRVEVGGLLAALSMLARAADDGPRALLRTAGHINLSVGMTNLLPLLPLDGGHLAVARLEDAGAGDTVIRAFRQVTVGLFTWLAVRVLLGDVLRLRRPTS